MAFLECKNVKINGIAACVPKRSEAITDYSFFNSTEAEKFSATTGVTRRRIAEPGTTSSDLCYRAARQLIDELGWNTSEIDALLFVSQSRDYIVPSTACILQHRLGLPDECYTMDIPYGCSGYPYGLSTLASLLQNGHLKKGLVLTGDVNSLQYSKQDKSSYPLFGDAGSATAMEFAPGEPGIQFYFGTDGSGFEAIMIPDGGIKNPVTTKSLELIKYSEGIKRTQLDCILNGMDVFSFGISRVPSSIKKLVGHFSIDIDSCDYLVQHQANKFMNEKIRKKVGFPLEKNPYSLEEFGNTCCSTIPLTMVTQLAEPLRKNQNKIITCGFGVGLSWGCAYYETDRITCPGLIEI